MAIRMMVSKEAYESNPAGIEVKNYDGNIVYLKTSHVGLVLELGEHNGYNDSDFYARVWNTEKKCIEKIEYATTRFWTYPNSATVDATPEVLAEVEVYLKAAAEKAKQEYELEIAKIPKIGDQVTVIKGRKLPKGTVGQVFWVGKDQFYERQVGKYRSPYSYLLPFKYYPEEYRVGIKLNDGTRVFVSAANIERNSYENCKHRKHG